MLREYGSVEQGRVFGVYLKTASKHMCTAVECHTTHLPRKIVHQLIGEEMKVASAASSEGYAAR